MTNLIKLSVPTLRKYKVCHRDQVECAKNGICLLCVNRLPLSKSLVGDHAIF
jgi:hypothetical protein